VGVLFWFCDKDLFEYVVCCVVIIMCCVVASLQGEASPSDLGFSLTCSDGSSCSAKKDPAMPSFSNSLSVSE
jgi:hypothetical protein